MSSLNRQYSQNITRSYVVTQSEFNNEQGPQFFSQDDIDTWYAANQSVITKLGKTLYVIPGTTPGTTFVDVLTGANGATELDHTLENIHWRKTLKDMGKEIVIGNRTIARLFVLRRVQVYTNSGDSGTLNADDTGYVVVENNAYDLGGEIGRFNIKVARI